MHQFKVVQKSLDDVISAVKRAKVTNDAEARQVIISSIEVLALCMKKIAESIEDGHVKLQ